MMPHFDEKKMEWEVYRGQFSGWYSLNVKFDPAKNPNWLTVRAWPRKPSDEEVSVTKGIAIRVLDLFVDHTNYCESVAAREAVGPDKHLSIDADFKIIEKSDDE